MIFFCETMSTYEIDVMSANTILILVLGFKNDLKSADNILRYLIFSLSNIEIVYHVVHHLVAPFGCTIKTIKNPQVERNRIFLRLHFNYKESLWFYSNSMKGRKKKVIYFRTRPIHIRQKRYDSLFFVQKIINLITIHICG
jgi:hypothetical protein